MCLIPSLEHLHTVIHLWHLAPASEKRTFVLRFLCAIVRILAKCYSFTAQNASWVLSTAYLKLMDFIALF